MIVILSGAEGSLRFLDKLGMTGVAWNDRFGYYSVNLVRRRNDTQVVPYNVIRIVALW